VYHTLENFPLNGLFALDYITIAPTKYSTLAGFNLIIDDTDLSLRRHRSGNWTRAIGYDFGLGSVMYEGTMTGTNTTGSELSFNFIGECICTCRQSQSNIGGSLFITRVISVSFWLVEPTSRETDGDIFG